MAPYRSTQQLVLGGTTALAILLLAAGWIALRAASVGRFAGREMTHQSARWSAADVDRRFGAARRPAELEDLARTLDGLLDRLSAVLRHGKRVNEEISHELGRRWRASSRRPSSSAGTRVAGRTESDRVGRRSAPARRS